MFLSPSVQISEQILPYDRISPELAKLLEETPKHSYTAIIPDGKGGFMSFYVKDTESAKEGGLESVRNQILNMIMADKREQVLGDYFARLRHNAEITHIREVQ
jgi:putative heme iron utilization protein